MKNFDLQQLLGKLKALPPNYLFMVLGFVVVLVVAVDVFLIARPQVASIMALDAKAKQLKVDIEELSGNKQRLPKFRVNLDDNRRQMNDFQAMVHKEDAIPSVLKTISTLANEYGVKIDQLVPQKSDDIILVQNEDGKYRSLSILVRARAGYHDLGRFLNRLQQEHVFWQLEAIDIAADEQQMGRHLVKMQMKILILGGK
jgi:Tfp pilus assembly protein PilO